MNIVLFHTRADKSRANTLLAYTRFPRVQSRIPIFHSIVWTVREQRLSWLRGSQDR